MLSTKEYIKLREEMDAIDDTGALTQSSEYLMHSFQSRFYTVTAVIVFWDDYATQERAVFDLKRRVKTLVDHFYNRPRDNVGIDVKTLELENKKEALKRRDLEMAVVNKIADYVLIYKNSGFDECNASGMSCAYLAGHCQYCGKPENMSHEELIKQGYMAENRSKNPVSIDKDALAPADYAKAKAWVERAKSTPAITHHFENPILEGGLTDRYLLVPADPEQRKKWLEGDWDFTTSPIKGGVDQRIGRGLRHKHETDYEAIDKAIENAVATGLGAICYNIDGNLESVDVSKLRYVPEVSKGCTPETPKMSKAYIDGKNAFDLCLSPNDNPYKTIKEYQEWLIGWDTQKFIKENQKD